MYETPTGLERERWGRVGAGPKAAQMEAWEETPAAFGARLRLCCADVNDDLDVEGLCKAFPGRIQKLVDREGGRLKE